VWPAGGHGEVRRAAARCLDAAADLVDGTTDWLAGAAPVATVTQRLGVMTVGLVRYEATYTQFRSERHTGHVVLAHPGGDEVGEGVEYGVLGRPRSRRARRRRDQSEADRRRRQSERAHGSGLYAEATPWRARPAARARTA